MSFLYSQLILFFAVFFFDPAPCSSSYSSFMTLSHPLVVGTRLHLGNTCIPPSTEDLISKITQFHQFCTISCQGAVGVIAVDATPKIANYSLVDTVSQICQQWDNQIIVLPVTPWGDFVPALNALVTYACKQQQQQPAERILFISAETSTGLEDIQQLLTYLEEDTLVVGARLPGHAYRGDDGTCVALSGTTCPWNTLAVWNLKKLALTGFQLVSDGLLTDAKTEPSFGVEEVVATALLQKLLGKDHAKAKLIALKSVNWRVDDWEDPERRKWHEEKMKSKEIRAQRQLDFLKLTGEVYHY